MKAKQKQLFIIFSVIALLLFFFLLAFVKNSLFLVARDNILNQIKNDYVSSSKDAEFVPTDDPLVYKAAKQEITSPQVSSANPNQGNTDAPVILVEFCDFSSAACVDLADKLGTLQKNNQDKVRLIWKDYPLLDLNSTSLTMHMAARCADKQNQFWQYHDLLLANQSKTGNSSNLDFYIELSRELGMNEANFKTCLESGQTLSLINDDLSEADELGISTIPSLYINNKQIENNLSLEDLQDLIEEAINEK